MKGAQALALAGSLALAAAACERPAESAIVFADATASAGIHFTTLSGPSTDWHPYEVIGGAAAWLDCDQDGRTDLFLVGRGGCALYGNLGSGRFEDRTAASGLATGQWGMGAAVGDYDGDGDPDLFATRFGGDLLFQNDGGRFSEVGRAAGVAGPAPPARPRWSAGAVFADFDEDGDLDLFVATYFEYDPKEAARPRCSALDFEGRRLEIYCGPAAYDGAGDVFYRNRGDGTFTDDTKRSGVGGGGAGRSKGLGVLAADLDGDGSLDLYVAGDAVRNDLYLGRGAGAFRDFSLESGAALGDRGQAEGAMGVDAADQDGDGILDLFVTNYTDEPNRLYRGLGGGRFEDATAKSGAGIGTRHLVGWGCGLLDLDLDGDLDLLVANGHIHVNAERWAWPKQSFEQTLACFRNSQGRFEDVSARAGPPFAARWSWRGLAFADYDDDGDLDAAAVPSGGPAMLLENRGGSGRSWATVRLQRSRRGGDATGARVEVRSGGRKHVRWAVAGGSYLSVNDPRLHFGLGEAERIDSIEVLWPGGRVQSFGPAGVRRHLVLREE